MEIQDLINKYEIKTNEELLRLALHSEQLTSQAATVLNNELARRKIDGTARLSFSRAGRASQS
jgi:hypothetical protein